jgi:hypothetical protein
MSGINRTISHGFFWDQYDAFANDRELAGARGHDGGIEAKGGRAVEAEKDEARPDDQKLSVLLNRQRNCRQLKTGRS